jgi:hypothetical protein
MTGICGRIQLRETLVAAAALALVNFNDESNARRRPEDADGYGERAACRSVRGGFASCELYPAVRYLGIERCLDRIINALQPDEAY